MAVAAALGGEFHGLKLIFEDRLRIIEQASDEGGLAIID
jgi:hypothetical protein